MTHKLAAAILSGDKKLLASKKNKIAFALTEAKKLRRKK
jgi:hypothetical protein